MVAALVVLSAPMLLIGHVDAQPAQRGSSSGLAIPRFVSLKADRVNLRSGPGTDYPTSWVFNRAGLPVEVLNEYEAWRQVRDAEGSTGWVLHTMLSGRRTALVLPWELKEGQPPPQTPLLDDDSPRARPVAIVEAGLLQISAVATVAGASWYRHYRGYIEQNKLWGVYAGEVIR